MFLLLVRELHALSGRLSLLVLPGGRAQCTWHMRDGLELILLLLLLLEKAEGIVFVVVVDFRNPHRRCCLEGIRRSHVMMLVSRGRCRRLTILA